MSLTTLLVGSSFRPPAKVIIAHAPSGSRLRLEAEPENPYDPAAVKVLFSPREIPPSEHPTLAEELPSCGWTLEDLLAEKEIFLGYLASASGKPLAIARERGLDLASNQDFAEAQILEGFLTFSPSGEALVTTEAAS